MSTSPIGEWNSGSPTNGLALGEPEVPADGGLAYAIPERPKFRPRQVSDFEAAGVNPAQVEGLILKYLLTVGMASGRRIAQELGLPFRLFPEFLQQLQVRKMIVYSNTAAANDFEYMLTEAGRNRGKAFYEDCSYIGPAPVPFQDYVASVAAQSIADETPRADDLRRAFSDLLISDDMFATLGPAINSGRGMFLYGAPGNGKTSIAERITRCFGLTIWIPRVVEIDGLIIKLFDPAIHEEVVSEARTGWLRGDEPDGRWVEIRRPTIIVGGELTMDSLEMRYDPVTRVTEAPCQMKSNNGIFLIDDFGRQRVPPMEILNRMIVPLEKRYDFLTLANGKKVRVPFDQLMLFSTNLEPKQLVDEAFLRRIPYKVQAVDPTEDQFREMFYIFASKYGFEEVNKDSLDYLIDHHYKRVNRPFRCCQPRDLMLQIRNFCVYNDLPNEMRREYFDFAAQCYFAVM